MITIDILEQLEHFIHNILTKKYILQHSKFEYMAHNGMKSIFRENLTGKSFSEVLILALTNPQYDKRLSVEFTSSVHENSKLRTWGEHG